MTEAEELRMIFESIWKHFPISQTPFPDDFLTYQNHCGDNCLHIAVMSGELRAIELLLDLGLDINSRGYAGNSPLHYASTYCFDDTTYQMLLDKGADASLTNDVGETAKDAKRKSEEISSIFVRSKIRFLNTNEGGRQTPVLSGYRPNHVILPSKIGTSVGEINFHFDEKIALGQEVEAEIHFMNLASLVDHIKPDLEWEIYEGPKLVACAKVVEILRFE